LASGREGKIVSPVFRHGGLRLYLLKLLDEAPRHGYDVIRLLQDRFLGVYSPSPGTIYPRLARLEEEGLVTHELIDGKKVYKITDAGRAELNQRLDDLADLEDELSASVRDIARELTRDVRETVRNLRDEFTWAVREAGRTGHDPRRGRPEEAESEDADRAQAEADRAQARADAAQAEADAAQAEADMAQARVHAAQAETDQAAADVSQEEQADEDARADGPAGAESVWSKASGEATGTGAGGTGQSSAGTAGAGTAGQDRTTGQRASTDGAAETGQGGAGEAGSAGAGEAGSAGAGEAGSAGEGGAGSAGAEDKDAAGAGAGARGQRRWPSGGWREWAEWAERGDWREWADWAEQRDWREWAGKQEWKDRAKASSKEWRDWAKASKAEWTATGRARRAADRELVVDLERLAAAFAREIRGVAWQAEALSEDAVGNLSRILTDALSRIRSEVFRPQSPDEKDS